MREILFRGFHPYEDGDKTVYVEGRAVKGEWVEGGYWLNDIVTRQTTYIISFDGDPIRAIPSTIEQYTGLTDKNGTKIFEGDILFEKNTGYKAVVEWQSDTCRYLAIIINRNSENSPNFFYVDKGSDRGCQMSSNEIIGNTHEEGRDERLD